MRSALALFRRELYSWAVTPAGYVLGSVFLALSGYFFTNILFVYQDYCRRMAGIEEMQSQLNATEMVIRPLIMNMAVLVLLLMPLVTMRLFAEERSRGTLELLRLSPLSTSGLVLAKFSAAGLVFSLALTVSLVFPLILSLFTAVEWPAVFCAWFGLWLLGLLFLAIGLFASSLTESQRVAGLTAFGLLLGFWVASWAAALTDGVLAAFLRELAAVPHMNRLARGIVDSRDLAWFMSFTGFFLFLTGQALASLRWRT